MARRGSSPYRSGLERNVAAHLEGLGQEFEYEPFRIPYVQPLTLRHYRPDFVLPNGIIVEAKGRWTTADRQKFIMVTSTYPELDLRFVFSNANARISKQSKTTYAQYCRSHGWQYATGLIPVDWIREKPNKASLELIRKFMNAPCNR